MSVRGRVPAGVAWLSALACVLGVAVSPASAAIGHKYETQITGVSLTEPLGAPWGLAFDGSGNLFVADAEQEAIDVFDASNTFVPPQLTSSALRERYTRGVAVSTSGVVYVAESGPETIDVFGPEGGGKYQLLQETKFGGYLFTAVDNHPVGPADPRAGDVYVHSNRSLHVVKVDAQGRLEGEGEEIPPPPRGFSLLGSGAGLAVDAANGNVYVANPEEKKVDVFDAHGKEQSLLELSGAETPQGAQKFSPNAVGIDDLNEVVYVADEAGGVVDEFSKAGTYLGQITGQGSPGERFSKPVGIAVQQQAGATQGDVYVSDEGAKVVDVFSPGLTLPDVTTGSAGGLTSRSATLSGSVNPLEVAVSECEFEYRTSEEPSFTHSAPCSPTPGSGSARVAVSAEISGLSLSTTYRYRLAAGNQNGTSYGREGVFTTFGPPVLDGEWVSDVKATSATFNAAINPHGTAATYFFQYSASSTTSCQLSSSSCVNVPATPDSIAPGVLGDVHVTFHVQGLTSADAYHYRVVVASEVAPGEPSVFYGEDRTFTTQAAGGEFALPDGRRWELVSPPNKQGAGIEGFSEVGGAVQAAEDGHAFTYVTNAPIVAEPQGNRALEDTQVYATRTSHGWETENITTPSDEVTNLELNNNAEYKIFSGDLSLGLVEPRGFTALPPLKEGAERTIYLRDAAADGYVPLVTRANVLAEAKFGGYEGGLNKNVEFLGASRDLKHVVFHSQEALVAPAQKGMDNLYEWSGGVLSLVSILPNNEPENGGLGLSNQVKRNAVSADGNRIAWGLGPALYLRDMARKETVEISAPQGGSEPGEAHFQTASGDGSRVFFTDNGRLTEDSHAGNGPDLYVFEVSPGAALSSGTLTDLTPSGRGGTSADVRGEALGASEDGSYVYFVADGALAPDANPGECDGIDIESKTSAECALYVAHHDASHDSWEEPKLIAELSKEDQPDWNSDVVGALELMVSEVSANGRFVAFMSDRSLTGYDTKDAVSGVADEEVYLYDATTERVVCASCNASGARPAGRFHPNGEDPTPLVDKNNHPVWHGRWLAGNVSVWTSLGENELGPQTQPHYLTNDGRLFFNGADGLVPADVNGTADAYQYEPEGVGGCKRGVASSSSVYSETLGLAGGTGGCVELISSGSSSQESAFLGASANGGDVFFVTAARLAREDVDTALDVYDAHECPTGSSCPDLGLVASPACTTAESCRAAPSPQPAVFGSPSSATFSGAGNHATVRSAAIAPKRKKIVRCAKGKKRVRGKCVKTKAKRAGATKFRESHGKRRGK